METLIAFLFTFLPITISPGPANLLLASSVATFGVRRTIPVLVGIILVFVVQIVVVGVGIGELLFRYPALFTLFQYVGAAFLLYLAYLFFQSSGIKDQTEAKLGFREGALLQLFNFKALTVPLILFTQFLNPQSSGWSEIILLGTALAVVIAFSIGVWTLAGSMLRRLFQSEFGVKWQGKIFGVMLALVAIWIILR